MVKSEITNSVVLDNNQDNYSTVIEPKVFRFVLMLNDETLLDRCFDGSIYNHDPKFPINIKKQAQGFIYGFQKHLSRTNVTTRGNGYDFVGDYLKRSKDLKDNNFNNVKLKKRGDGEWIVDKVDSDKKYYENTNENFRFILFLNDKHIIERNFYVMNYNPYTRFSTELNSYFNDVVLDIQSYLKYRDSSVMWDDYTLETKFNLKVEKIKSLTLEERYNFLHRYNN